MSCKRARKILHSNGIEYVRFQHDKKQIVVNQVITLYIMYRLESEHGNSAPRLRGGEWQSTEKSIEDAAQHSTTEQKRIH